MTTANTWTREDQRLARLKQADEFAAQEIARMLAEIERGWAEIERLTDLGGDDAVRAAQATEIDRLTEHLAHTRDAANKLYQAAAAFCEGWDHEAITLCFGGLTREQFEALLAALDPCEREATRRDGLERELAALRADVAEKSAEVAATMRRHREEKDALDREVASLRSTPIGQALDLLRRTRAVLHKLDPAHEKLRGEIDALLAGMPIVESASPSLTERAAVWDSLPAEERRGFLEYLHDDARDVRDDKDFGPRWTRTLRAVSEALARSDAPSAMVDRGATPAPTPCNRFFGLPNVYGPQPGDRCDACHRTRGEHALLAGAPVVETEEADASRPGLTEEEARSLAEHVGIKLGLAKDDREEPVTTATRAILGWFASRGDIPPDVRPPHTHPLTEEEARIARGLHACAGAWEPDVRLIGNLTAREIERFASAILSRGEIPPDVRAVAASSAAGEWQCVSCHAREREMHREWCEIEGAAGTVASRATDVRPVAPFTEEEARRSLGAALREAAKQNAIYSPMCAVRAGADVGRVAPKVEEPMLTPAEEADVIAGAPAQIAPHGQSEIEILRAAVVRAHERIDALEKKPVEATIAAMAAQIERLDAEMRHVLVTIARRPKVEGDDVEAEEDPRTRLHEVDPEGKPATLKERLSRVVLGTIDGEPVHVRATSKDKP